MKLDALFDFAQVFNIDARIDVLQGQRFTLIMDQPEGIEVFSNNDKVLTLDHTATDVVVTASELGDSKVRFMTDTAITKEILIRVVSEFVRPATDLGVTIGHPESK
jgi:outer membrane lipoprotein-sorting protein